MISKISAFFFVFFVAMHPAFGFDLDVTNDPNVGFFVGYTKKYGPHCEINFWQSRWETNHLMSPDECSNVTREQVYKDINSEMQRVRNVSKAESFADYYREVDQRRKDELEYQFCLDKIDHVLIFTKAGVKDKPGWNYIAYSKFSRYGSVNKTVGSWKSLNKKNILADFGRGVVTVDKSKAISC